jgi:DNA recombination protein RmuC
MVDIIIGIVIGAILFALYKKSETSTVDQRLDTIQAQITQLAEVNKQNLDINKNVIELQNILKIPKSRGIHGEILLNEQLAILPSNFVEIQYQFKTGSICDAVIRVGNNLLCIDSKFSLENFHRRINSADADEAKQFEKSFYKDIKNRIKEIREKYIIPSEGTLNFALMYIPAESVYYHTFVEKNNSEDLYVYALNNNVYPVSPNLLHPYLEILLFGFRSLEIEANAHKIQQGLLDIQSRLQLFVKTYKKATEQLRNAQRNFQEGEDHFVAIQTQLRTLGYRDTTALENDENKNSN